MKISISSKYALYSLWRHSQKNYSFYSWNWSGMRLMFFMVGFIRGEGKMMLQAAAESGNGHFRIVPTDWEQFRDNDLRLPHWKEIRKMLK